MTSTFTINFDYRCPFARNANEHVVAALRAGADYSVIFKGFSLTEAHTAEGEISAFDDPAKRPELMAVAAGLVVRDRLPERFYDAHLSLFALRHDDGEDVRDPSKVAHALTRAGVDAQFVLDELESGWPYELLREEHTTSVKDHAVFGVPTFIANDEAVFVRLMTRPGGDAEVARRTVDRVLELLVGHPEINEYKHTTIPH